MGVPTRLGWRRLVHGGVMFRSLIIGCTLAVAGFAQDPFKPMDLKPLDLGAGGGQVLDRSGARQDWVKITNTRMEMAGRTLRVALADADGLTAVVLAKDVTRTRHAKPILYGRGEYAELFKSIVGLGFTRILVRNPDTRQEWAARLERGKAILED
jgi:hypothetical protein